MDLKNSLILQVAGVACGVIACCITFYTLSKFGRRSLMIVSMAIITALWGAIGFCGIRQDAAGAMWRVQPWIVQLVSSSLTNLVGLQPLVCYWSSSRQALVHGVSDPMCEMFDRAKLTSCPAASYAVASEASSYRVRAKTQGLGWFGYGLGTMVFGFAVPYLYVSLVALYPWSLLCIKLAANMCLSQNPDAAIHRICMLCSSRSRAGRVLLPEMKGRSPGEIDKMFAARIPTRSFLHWTNTSSMAA